MIRVCATVSTTPQPSPVAVARFTLSGYGVWKGMHKAVEELLRAVPGEGERVN